MFFVYDLFLLCSSNVSYTSFLSGLGCLLVRFTLAFTSVPVFRLASNPHFFIIIHLPHHHPIIFTLGIQQFTTSSFPSLSTLSLLTMPSPPPPSPPCITFIRRGTRVASQLLGLIYHLLWRELERQKETRNGKTLLDAPLCLFLSQKRRKTLGTRLLKI